MSAVLHRDMKHLGSLESTLTHLSYSPNFLTFILTYEPIVNCNILHVYGVKSCTKWIQRSYHHFHYYATFLFKKPLSTLQYASVNHTLYGKCVMLPQLNWARRSIAPNYPVNLRWRVIYWLVRGFRVVPRYQDAGFYFSNLYIHAFSLHLSSGAINM